MLNKIKLLVGVSPTDEGQNELFEVLIEMAQQEAVEYCHLEEYNEKLNPTIIKMVIEKYNRLGSEGITSQNYSGVSESFAEGYSKDIIASLNRNRKLRMM